ncbi:KCNIP4 [Cordylochernes scorpioides]|uniref:KCNIP4 n=1 Tax=Cordylochernes scorpioides TaxID=51811 RepID=A0ABY6L0P6_9ARAC|nr:KCNIP4 [Cordylochernes scorpioides]
MSAAADARATTPGKCHRDRTPTTEESSTAMPYPYHSTPRRPANADIDQSRRPTKKCGQCKQSHNNQVKPETPQPSRLFETKDYNTVPVQDFIRCLSVLCRGSVQEKIQWAFNLYDINGDGFITKKELTDIVSSVHSLVATPSYGRTLKEHVDKIFEKLDLDKDGVVTKEEFVDACLRDYNTVPVQDFIRCLSVLCRGSVQEKIQWAFNLYDINGDGFITKKELTDIVSSVHSLVATPSYGRTLKEHVDKIFEDESIGKSLTLFDTLL